VNRHGVAGLGRVARGAVWYGLVRQQRQGSACLGMARQGGAAKAWQGWAGCRSAGLGKARLDTAATSWWASARHGSARQVADRQGSTGSARGVTAGRGRTSSGLVWRGRQTSTFESWTRATPHRRQRWEARIAIPGTGRTSNEEQA
jgi:hypothetical protein